MGLTLDPQLIRDLTVLITSSTVGGMVLEALRQPVINGFFIAGSVVGPGGFKLIKVCTSPCACAMDLMMQCMDRMQIEVRHTICLPKKTSKGLKSLLHLVIF